MGVHSDSEETTPRVVIKVNTFAGYAPGARHWYATLETKHRSITEKFPSKYLARAWVNDMLKEDFEGYVHVGIGGTKLPWVYVREE